MYNLQHARKRMTTTQVQQVDLWSKEGLKYSVEHARAKLAMTFRLVGAQAVAIRPAVGRGGSGWRNSFDGVHEACAKTSLEDELLGLQWLAGKAFLTDSLHLRLKRGRLRRLATKKVTVKRVCIRVRFRHKSW